MGKGKGKKKKQQQRQQQQLQQQGFDVRTAIQVESKAVEEVIATVDQVTDAVVAQAFGLSGKTCNHRTASNCGSVNCFTGLGEGEGATWSEEARQLLVTQRTQMVEDPKTRLRVRDVGDETARDNDTGLRNLGATCYMNSLLQVLYATLPFRSALYACDTTRAAGEAVARYKMEVIQLLRLLFAGLQEGNSKWLRPDSLVKKLEIPAGEQQDAQEFLQLLFGNIFDATLSPKVAEALRNFQGFFDIRLKCPLCGHVSHRREEATIFSLPLEEKLTQSLSKLTQPEQLEGDTLVECGGCGKRMQGEKTTCIAPDTPNVLVFQLLRFVFEGGERKKKMVSVTAPRTLDVSPFVAVPGEGNAAPQPADLEYELYAVVCHIGNSSHAGHYVAHVRRKNGTWVELDDDEVRIIDAADVGLTISMRNAQTTKGKSSDRRVEDEDEWSSTSNSGRGRKKNQKKNGAAAQQQQHHQSNEHLDFTKFTKGSSAPYLLFYKRKSVDWDKVECAVPEDLTAVVLKENDTLFEQAQLYGSMFAEMTNLYDELLALYQRLPVTESDSTYYWLSTKWLREWIKRPEQTDGFLIDNSDIVCPHGGVSPKDTTTMKRISEAAWQKLYQRHGGGPALPRGSECKQCVVDVKLADEAARLRRERIAQVKAALKNTNLSERSNFFYMSTQWLATWKQDANAAAKGDINKDIRCPHDSLTAFSELYTRVEPRVWEFFRDEFPESQEWPKSSRPCETCTEERQQQELRMKERRQERDAIRKQFDVLLNRKKPTLLSKLPAGPNFVIACSWVEKLRSYLDDLSLESVDPPDNSSLVCPHSKLRYTLSSELLADDASVVRNAADGPRPRVFYVVTDKNWHDLCARFGNPVHEIPVAIGGMEKKSYKAALEECAECIELAKREEAEARRTFVNKEIVIQRASAARTATAYHLRQKVKKSRDMQSSFRVTTSASDTVQQLKLLIFQAQDILPLTMRLSHKGRALENEEADLASYGISAGAVIDLDVLELDGLAEVVVVSNGGNGANRRPERGFHGSRLTDTGMASSEDVVVEAAPSSSSASSSSLLMEGEIVSCSSCTYDNTLQKNQTVCSICDHPLTMKKAKTSE